MRSICVLLLHGLTVCASHAQTFDLEQFEQVFRPRLRIDGRFQPESAFRDTAGGFSNAEGTAVLTFPIASRFKAGFELDTAARGLREVLTNSVRVEARQLLGSVRLGARQVQIGFDSTRVRNLYTASAGLMGIHLTRKLRVLFWSANVNISEEDHTMEEAVPRFTGLVGKMKVKGLRRQFFYGLAASFTDGLSLPVPFIGGSAPMGKKWSFNYVLPLQASFGWKVADHTRLNLGLGLDGNRSGIGISGERHNMNYGALRVFANVRHKLSRHLMLRAEAGYALGQRLNFSPDDVEVLGTPVRLEPGPSAMLGINVLFGQSILDRIIEEVLK